MLQVAVEAAPAASAQTHFSVKLLAFDDKAKLKVIKTIKDLFTGINVVEARRTHISPYFATFSHHAS